MIGDAFATGLRHVGGVKPQSGDSAEI